MKTSNGKQLAKKMLIAMICGLACGFWMHYAKRTLSKWWTD